jgi:hypothetical protein
LIVKFTLTNCSWFEDDKTKVGYIQRAFGVTINSENKIFLWINPLKLLRQDDLYYYCQTQPNKSTVVSITAVQFQMAVISEEAEGRVTLIALKTLKH